MVAADLNRDTFLQMARAAFRIERVRLIEQDGPSVEQIARLPSRWKHHGSIWQPDGERFDIWVNWDDKVRIEHNGEVILRMSAPAGAILRAIDDRRMANGR